jgi:hypothetical protein
MDGLKEGWMDGWIDRFIDARTGELIDGALLGPGRCGGFCSCSEFKSLSD